MTALETTFDHWTHLDPDLQALLAPITDDAAYERALAVFEALMVRVTAQPGTPLTALYQLLGEHLHAYESRTVSVPDAPPNEVLRFLMDQHGLSQRDLPEVGSQGVVSELLSGKRQVNARQARLLAAHFHITPAVFI